MADLDDFFAKKDKKKKGKSGFSKANTEVLAKNLEESDRREHKEETGRALATSEAVKMQNVEDEEAAAAAVAATASNASTAPTTVIVGSNNNVRTVSSVDNLLGKDGKDNFGGVVSGGGGSKYFGICNDEMNDDEWLDYTNQKKDYSGLKIETLKINESDKLGDDDHDHEINEEGEKVLRVKKGDGGPWNRNKANKQENESRDDDSDDSDSRRSGPSPTPAAAAASSSANNDNNSESSGGAPKSSYVPPHMRAGTQASGASLAPVRLSSGGGGGGHMSSMSGPRGMRNRQAPDINSDVYFPSLAATSNPAEDAARSRKGGKEQDFKEVRSGGQQMSSRSTEAPKLALGNKFDALRE